MGTVQEFHDQSDPGNSDYPINLWSSVVQQSESLTLLFDR